MEKNNKKIFKIKTSPQKKIKIEHESIFKYVDNYLVRNILGFLNDGEIIKARGISKRFKKVVDEDLLPFLDLRNNFHGSEISPYIENAVGKNNLMAIEIRICKNIKDTDYKSACDMIMKWRHLMSERKISIFDRLFITLDALIILGSCKYYTKNQRGSVITNYIICYIHKYTCYHLRILIAAYDENNIEQIYDKKDLTEDFLREIIKNMNIGCIFEILEPISLNISNVKLIDIDNCISDRSNYFNEFSLSVDSKQILLNKLRVGIGNQYFI